MAQATLASHLGIQTVRARTIIARQVVQMLPNIEVVACFVGPKVDSAVITLHELQIIRVTSTKAIAADSSLQCWEYNVSLTTLVVAKHSPRTMCGTC